MSKVRLISTLALALVLGLVASTLVYQKLRQSSVRAAGSSTRVMAAARNLEIGAKITETDLKTVDSPSGTLPQGSFAKASDAVGRAVLYPAFEGELILESKLAPVGSGAGLPAVIPDGMRAVSIRVDDVVAVAGFVGPGTRVDVLLTGNPDISHREQSLTRTILENVQVLAAGQKIQPDDQGRAEKVNVVTLLCSPEDAARVTLAASDGRIQLVLRNPADSKTRTSETVVARQALYGRAVAAPAPQVQKRPKPQPAPVVAAAPVAPPPPPPPTIIEVIRGEKIARVEIPN